MTKYATNGIEARVPTLLHVCDLSAHICVAVYLNLERLFVLHTFYYLSIATVFAFRFICFAPIMYMCSSINLFHSDYTFIRTHETCVICIAHHTEATGLWQNFGENLACTDALPDCERNAKCTFITDKVNLHSRSFLRILGVCEANWL